MTTETEILPSNQDQPASPRRRAVLSKSLQLSIYRRDSWLCYWCARPVIFPPAMKLMELELRQAGITEPLAYYHSHWTRTTSPLLDELGVVLDHIDAFSSGGECTENNLVTACSKCNVRKSNSSMERWEQRKKRKPIKGRYGEPESWDGLSTTFVTLAQRHFDKLSASDRDWIKALTASS